MKPSILLPAILSLSVTITAHAAPLNPAHFPMDLIYLNHPIDPLCFFDLENNSDPIHLKDCGLIKNRYVTSGKSDTLIKRNFYGFDWKDPAESYPGGYSYYQAYDAGNKNYWVYTVNSGGGSGDFTAINLYSRKNSDTAILKSIAGGDRCNGGIGDVKDSGSTITYSVNLTAFDLYDLANDNPHKLKAYDDLSACAACCAAKAFYTLTANAEPKLQYVDLDGDVGANDLSPQGSYHECFNKLFSSYVVKGKTKLSVDELKQFVKKFNETCLK